MRGTIPVKGVISLCASKPNSFTDENIQRLSNKGVKIVFMEGEKDVPVESVEYMMKELKGMGIPYEYFINEDIGHWYPKDMDKKVARAVEFILA